MTSICGVTLLLVASTAAFSPAAMPSQLSGVVAVARPCVRQLGHGHARSAAAVPGRLRVEHSPQMGLFGLGWPEIAVIGAVSLFLVGPDKLAPLAKDLGALSGPPPASFTRPLVTAHNAVQRADCCARYAPGRR